MYINEKIFSERSRVEPTNIKKKLNIFKYIQILYVHTLIIHITIKFPIVFVFFFFETALRQNGHSTCSLHTQLY